ncbi:LysR family transcriptional regulator [Chelativorans sp.]|uniref:LysR family transcriptional regulator n=1 Tax=Chelativorans sp. TaxID=2203393 RepID=UPI0028128ABF|nr:LysR family transcriptional regulator [Chelativorans sp.]
MRPELFSLLPVFRIVATKGGFTAASGPLGVTPSAVSQKIRQLEALLGVRVFERTSRSVRLTEAGRILLDNVDTAFDQITGAIEGIQALGKQPAGNLRINLSRLAAQVCIVPQLPGFVRRYPGIALELTSDDRLTDIVAGGFDAGIRFPDALEMDMIARPIGPKLRRVTVASRTYLETAGTPQHPADLAAHAIIRFRLPGSQRLVPLTFNVEGEILQIDPSPRLVFNDDDHIGLAVQEGLGIAQRYRVTGTPAASSGDVVELLKQFEPAAHQFHLYYPSRNQPPKLQAFIEWFCG